MMQAPESFRSMQVSRCCLRRLSILDQRVERRVENEPDLANLFLAGKTPSLRPRKKKSYFTSYVVCHLSLLQENSPESKPALLFRTTATSVIKRVERTSLLPSFLPFLHPHPPETRLTLPTPFTYHSHRLDTNMRGSGEFEPEEIRVGEERRTERRS